MMDYYFLICKKLYVLVLIIGFVSGIFFIKKSSPAYRIFIIYFLLLFVCYQEEQYSIMMYKNNLHSGVLYSLLEIGFYTFLYQRFLFKKVKIPFLLLSVASVIYSIYELLTTDFQDIANFQLYARPISSMLIAGMAVFYLIYLLQNLDIKIWKTFWLNSFILIFYSLQAIMELPYNYYYIFDETTFTFILITNIFVYFFFYSSIIICIWIDAFDDSKKLSSLSLFSKENSQIP